MYFRAQEQLSFIHIAVLQPAHVCIHSQSSRDRQAGGLFCILELIGGWRLILLLVFRGKLQLFVCGCSYICSGLKEPVRIQLWVIRMVCTVLSGLLVLLIGGIIHVVRSPDVCLGGQVARWRFFIKLVVEMDQTSLWLFRSCFERRVVLSELSWFWFCVELDFHVVFVGWLEPDNSERGQIMRDTGWGCSQWSGLSVCTLLLQSEQTEGSVRVIRDYFRPQTDKDLFTWRFWVISGSQQQSHLVQWNTVRPFRSALPRSLKILMSWV